MRETLSRYGLVVVLVWAVVMASAIQIASASSSSPFWEKSGTTVFYNDGNVGIGTSAPAAKLHVYHSGTGSMKIEGGTAGAPGLRATLELASDRDYRGRGVLFTAGDSADWFAGVPYTGNGFSIGFGAAADRKLYSKLFLSENGNLGVGTTAAQARIHAYHPSTGIVRIEGGTNGSPSTRALLELVSDSDYRARGVVMKAGDASSWFAGVPYTGGGYSIGQQGTDWERKAASMFYVANNGNVGIGTTSPSEKLDVAGNIKASGTICDGSGACIGATNLSDYLRRDQDIIFSGFERSIKKLDMLVGTNDLRFYGNDDGITDMYIAENGNIGIGTMSTNDGYKLSVNGKVRATEVVVYSGWADYVFEEGYNLMPLRDVASYIQANKHLPNVKSAEEIEANGVSVGETQAKLLEKIEELTLYAIEQEGKAERQQAQIDSLIREVLQLKAGR